MNIKQLKIKRFAGLKDIDLKFTPGINVVLGPNEAGKSTLTEAIRFGLLMPVALKGLDKQEFENRFLPRSGGDTVDVELLMAIPGGEFRLAKTFGHRPSVQMETGGTLVTRDTVVYQQLNSILGYGQKTIDALVFARQRDFQNIFHQLSDQELAQGIEAVLEHAVMELGGYSVQKIEELINEGINQLTGHWNLEKGCPEGGRGIERPFQRGVGAILASYYEQERIGLRMKMVLETEQKLNRLVDKVNLLTMLFDSKQEEIKQLAAWEDDMLRRWEIEPSLVAVQQMITAVKADIQDWPLLERGIERQQEKLIETVSRLSWLKLEDEHSRRREERRSLAQLKTQVEECYEQEKVLLRNLAEIHPISESQMAELDNLDRQLEDIRMRLQAAQLKGRVKIASGRQGLLIHGFQEDTVIDETAIDAPGYVRLEIEGSVIEVQSGDYDYNQLRDQYEECRSALGGSLLQLGFQSVQEARNAYDQALALNREIDGLRIKASILLAGKTLDDIDRELNALAEVPPARHLSEIRQEQEALWELEGRLQRDIEQLKERLTGLELTYGTRDDASFQLGELEKEYARLNSELSLLKELPPEYQSVSDFRSYLKQCREEEKQLMHEISGLHSQYREVLSSLDSETYEDLQYQYEEAAARHQRLLARVGAYLQVKEAFGKTALEIKQLANQPLIEQFARRVDDLTAGRYGVVAEPGFLEFKLQHRENFDVPLSLLSAGTLDLMALAFRFSLLDKLFPENQGMVVLDDCMVDLDQDRKQKAAAMIKAWAENHQVIFATCDQGTAQLLGGNLISM